LAPSPSGATTPTGEKKKGFRKSWTGNDSSKTGYHLSAEHDIVGIVMLEISKADDLPRLKNSVYFHSVVIYVT
jgi:hypothetical protein